MSRAWTILLCWMMLLLSSAALAAPPRESLTGQVASALARLAITELSLDRAETVLGLADPKDPDVIVERARLLLHRLQCDEAYETLQSGNIAMTDDTTALFEIIQGCRRALASTIEVRDEERGIYVTLQSDLDAPLVPLLMQSADAARDVFGREIGTQLPRPMRIVVVSDQMSLAALTGLPLSAARTTGTVGIAKWGRVTVVSPRVSPHGFSWLDTLAHELVHLVVTSATLDRAPLWLQEGLAKTFETRWRTSYPFDNRPSSHALAFYGMQLGLGRALHDMGPSFALLPTAEESAVAYAEVSSFSMFFLERADHGTLPRLLSGLRSQMDPDVAAAMREVSGQTFESWQASWKTFLDSKPFRESATEMPFARRPAGPDPARPGKLGRLLADRGHGKAAILMLERALAIRPASASLSADLAGVLRDEGFAQEARELVAHPEARESEVGDLWALHGALASEDPGERATAWRRAVELAPWSPISACRALPSPELPPEPSASLLCEAARARAERMAHRP